MPSYLDLGLIVIMLISAFFDAARLYARGAGDRLLGGGAAAVYLYPLVASLEDPLHRKGRLRWPLRRRGVLCDPARRLADHDRSRTPSSIPRSARSTARSASSSARRAAFLCVIAFIFFNWLVPRRPSPNGSRPPRRGRSCGDRRPLIAMLPEDAEARSKPEKAEGPAAPARSRARNRRRAERRARARRQAGVEPVAVGRPSRPLTDKNSRYACCDNRLPRRRMRRFDRCAFAQSLVTRSRARITDEGRADGSDAGDGYG